MVHVKVTERKHDESEGRFEWRETIKRGNGVDGDDSVKRNATAGLLHLPYK
jgi:hypothetical protein